MYYPSRFDYVIMLLVFIVGLFVIMFAPYPFSKNISQKSVDENERQVQPGIYCLLGDSSFRVAVVQEIQMNGLQEIIFTTGKYTSVKPEYINECDKGDK